MKINKVLQLFVNFPPQSQIRRERLAADAGASSFESSVARGLTPA